MTTLISFLFVLGILVFVHEFGHFLAAKRAGVYVETFSIGMGPKLLKKKVGDTEYCISGIPLGGYVKMKGENPDEESTGAADELQSKSLLTRFSVFFAGPLMNIVLAILLVSLIYYIGIEESKSLEEPPLIGWIDPDSPAEKVGLQRKDLITRIGNTQVATWEDAMLLIMSAGDKAFNLEVLRDNQTLTIAIEPELIKRFGAGYIGVHPVITATIGVVNSGAPAAKAGIRPGDEVVAINGVPITHWYQMVSIIREKAEEELQLTVLRDGQTIQLAVTPQKDGDHGVIGVRLKEVTVLRKYGIKDSFVKGAARCWKMTKDTFDMLRRLITMQASTKSLGGPIMIAEMSGEMARLGFREFISFIGAVSLSLGIFNLLPIPVLDGGHIFLLLVEFLNRKPLSMQRRELAQKIGLLILIPLFVFIFYNDITRLLGW